MIQLTIDDESHAMSAWAHAETSYVGEDIIFAPRWATLREFATDTDRDGWQY